MKLVSHLANTITLGASKAKKAGDEAAKSKKQLKYEKEYFVYF